MLQVGTDRADNDRPANRDEFHTDNGNADPPIDDDTLVEDTVQNLQV